jgi:2-hydroxyacyl-CoA lyase 1
MQSKKNASQHLSTGSAVMATPHKITGAYIIAKTLKDLGVTAIFGIVGVPVSDIAEQAINLGIRFIGFRNEQAASYAASAYG